MITPHSHDRAMHDNSMRNDQRLIRTVQTSIRLDDDYTSGRNEVVRECQADFRVTLTSLNRTTRVRLPAAHVHTFTLERGVARPTRTRDRC